MKQFLLQIYFLIQKAVFLQIDQATYDDVISQGEVLETSNSRPNPKKYKYSC